MLKLTIDGKQVWAEEGDSILSAAQGINIHIPTLCHFKGQSLRGLAGYAL